MFFMLAQSKWLLQLPEILGTLTNMNSHVLDRAAFEELFGVRRRQAIVLIRSPSIKSPLRLARARP